MILQRSKEPKIKTVKDVVNKGAKPADPMPQGLKSGDEVELEDTQEVVAETEPATDRSNSRRRDSGRKD